MHLGTDEAPAEEEEGDRKFEAWEFHQSFPQEGGKGNHCHTGRSTLCRNVIQYRYVAGENSLDFGGIVGRTYSLQPTAYIPRTLSAIIGLL